MELEEVALEQAEVEARVVLGTVVAGAQRRRGHRPRRAIVKGWS